MLKKITWSDLLSSKTFWGAFVLATQQEMQAFAVYQRCHDGMALALASLTILSAMLAAVGIIDRTATPKAAS